MVQSLSSLKKCLVPLSFLFVAIGLFSACQNSYHVTQADSEQLEELDNVASKGFVYAFPTTHYKLSIEGRLKETIKGRLSEFHHLVKYPSGMTNQESQELLQIDSVALKAYTKPDFNRVYNVRLPEPHPGLFQKSAGYQMAMGQNLMLKGTHYKDNHEAQIQHPECHLINKNVTIPEQSTIDQSSNKQSLKFDQESVQSGIEQLLELNQSLVAKLKNTRNDSILAQDSLVQAKMKQMENEVDRYLGRIKEIKSLFEAYRGENLAEKAQKFSDIIHKLVELKTSLAGGDAAIDYPQTAIAPMIRSIDTMINNYLTPFQASKGVKPLQWEIPFHPTRDSLKFQYGIFKTDNNDYYVDESGNRSDYKALLQITVDPESLENISSFSEAEEDDNKDSKKLKGLVYNIPANADITIDLKLPEKATTIPLAQTTVTLPQLGVANRLPLDKGQRQYQLDPFTGALKVLEQNKQD